uniref:Uncharacterized protein n=1 Tax=Rhizophora mucronata TaxID=61149 RepID=A0A2P2NJ98_RHIMU
MKRLHHWWNLAISNLCLHMHLQAACIQTRPNRNRFHETAVSSNC